MRLLAAELEQMPDQRWTIGSRQVSELREGLSHGHGADSCESTGCAVRGAGPFKCAILQQGPPGDHS